MLYLIKVHSIFKNNNNGNRGYEPQIKLWERFAASFRVSYPPPCGIIRLAYLTTLRLSHWSLTKKGRIEIRPFD
jgi:hypothetical protein